MAYMFQDLPFYCTKKVPKNHNQFFSLSSRGWNSLPGACSDFDVLLHLLGNTGKYTPAARPIQRINFSNIALPGNWKCLYLDSSWDMQWNIAWPFRNPLGSTLGITLVLRLYFTVYPFSRHNKDTERYSAIHYRKKTGMYSSVKFRAVSEGSPVCCCLSVLWHQVQTCHPVTLYTFLHNWDSVTLAWPLFHNWDTVTLVWPLLKKLWQCHTGWVFLHN